MEVGTGHVGALLGEGTYSLYPVPPCVSPLSHLHPSPSILGMHIFGCKFSLRTDTGDTVPDRKNFDSLLWAIVTVFQVSPSLCPRVSVNMEGMS